MSEAISYFTIFGTWRRATLREGATFFLSTEFCCYFDLVGTCWGRRIYRERGPHTFGLAT
jgi:hypothetical protein